MAGLRGEKFRNAERQEKRTNEEKERTRRAVTERQKFATSKRSGGRIHP